MDTQSLKREIIAGVTLFSAIIYVVFAIPAILKPSGFPTSSTIPALLLAAGLGCLFSGIFIKRPIAIATGIATAVAAADSVSANSDLNYHDAIICTFVAGVAVLISSVSGFRMWLLKNLPDSVMNAIRSGIGALLAGAALDALVIQINGATLVDSEALGIFIPALSVVVIFYFIIPKRIGVNRTKKSSNIQDATTQVPIIQTSSRQASTLQSCAFFISIITAFFVTFLFSGQGMVVRIDPQFLWTLPLNDISGQINISGNFFDKIYIAIANFFEAFGNAFTPSDKAADALILIVAFYFISISDIAGSPYDYFMSQEGASARNLSAEQEKCVKRGFFLDASFSMLSGLFGVTPQAYYAENHAAWKSHGKTGVPAFVVGAGLLVLFLFVCWYGIALSVPKIVVAAPLLFVGLIIISDSLTISPSELRSRATQAEQIDKQVYSVLFGGERLYWIPAAATITATPVVGLEYSILLGIIAYLVFVWWLEKGSERHTDDTKAALYIWTVIGCLPAAVFLIFKIA